MNCKKIIATIADIPPSSSNCSRIEVQYGHKKPAVTLWRLKLIYVAYKDPIGISQGTDGADGAVYHPHRKHDLRSGSQLGAENHMLELNI